MATQIKVAPDEMHDMEAQLRRVIAEHERLDEETRQLLSSIGAAWEGDSIHVMLERLRSLERQDNAKREALIELADYIYKAHSTYVETESALSAQLGGLKS